MRSRSAAPERVSIRTLRPSVQPNCAKPLQERRYAGLIFRIASRTAHQHADQPHPFGPLLRARRERPCHGRAEQRYELAPFSTDRIAFRSPPARAELQDIELGRISQEVTETILQPVSRSLSSQWYCSILFSTENLFATCKFDRCSNLASKLPERRCRSRRFRRVPPASRSP
jgi:hypothetical protein